jgi:hypothetical protein
VVLFTTFIIEPRLTSKTSLQINSLTFERFSGEPSRTCTSLL